jgi:hypothetical protein
MQMLNKMRLKLLVAGLLSTTVMVGCGSDKPENDAPVATPFEVTAALGALQGASCSIVGATGTIFKSATTDDSGQVSVIIDARVRDFPVIISCSGGSYFDEATNALVDNVGSIKSVVPNRAVLDSLAKKIAVTTLTDLATTLYQSLPPENRTAETALASLTEVVRILAPALGENGGGLNILAAPTVVASPGIALDGTPAGKYAAYLAGLALVAEENGKTAAQLGQVLAEQIATGKAIDPVTVATLVDKVKAYASTNGNNDLKSDVANDNSGDGGAAEKPEPNTPPKTTGSTGSTGSTSTGATGG